MTNFSISTAPARVHYVSNKDLYAQLKVYYALSDEAVARGEEVPNPSPAIIDSIYRIASRLSSKPNFARYTYREDMVQDAVFTCFRKIKEQKFSIDKAEASIGGPNPFAYITQICWNAFIQRINKEHHETSVRSKLIANSNILDAFLETQEHDSDAGYTNGYTDFLQEAGALKDYRADAKARKVGKPAKFRIMASDLQEFLGEIR